MKHCPKRILFDGILLQTFAGGAAAYVYRVFCSLCSRILTDNLPISVYLLYDSTKKFVDDYPVHDLLKNEDRFIDICRFASVGQVVDEYKIDKLFIGCAQYWIKYNLIGIKCRSVVVIHDLFDCEIAANKLNSLVLDDNLVTWRRYVRLAVVNVLRSMGIRQTIKGFDYDHLMQMCVHDSVDLVTVSEYTSSALHYYFPQLQHKNIHVLYSPHKVVVCNDSIQDKQVNELIHSRKKYLLMVSANRWTKNARFAIDTFLRMNKDNLYLVTVGYPCSMGAKHIVCPFLSESDLEHLYRNAYALIYPSLEEGFGYPPIEAMRCGKPTLVSNVCSMPEICGDAALFFSPMHHNSLYMQLMKLEECYLEYVEKAKKRFAYIHNRQEEDLAKLLDLILD